MKGRNNSLLEASKASLTSAEFAARAVDYAHAEPLYTLAMVGLSIVYELHALTLTIEASIPVDDPPE